MTDERIEQLQALQSARATCERMGIGYVGMAGKIPWLLDTIARLSTERDEARDEALRLSALLDGVGFCREHAPTVEWGYFHCWRCDTIAAETSRDALLTAAKAVFVSGSWFNDKGWPEWDALRALVPSELAPSDGGDQ